MRAGPAIARASLVGLVALVPLGCTRQTTTGPVLWDLDWMTRVKESARLGDRVHAAALARLRQEADRALGQGPFSVMDKKLLPPSGDKHDYLSVAPYWWPDPGKPDGLPYIRKDGERNPSRNSRDTDNAAESAMAAAVETLGLAHFFFDHAPYADRAVKLLRVWFLDPATRMNPNLSFAQGILGVTPGRPAGVIDTVDLVPMLEAVDLLRRGGALPSDVESGLRGWFGQYLDWMLNSEIGKGERGATNNHGSWYDVQVSRFALFAGREALAKSVAADARAGRVAAQIQPDGRQPRELERTRSFHYSGFNLTALFSLGAMGGKLGVDLYRFEGPEGRSLRRALDYLLPYLDPDKPWPYKQLGGREPGGLIPVLRRAGRIYGDPRYAAALERFGGDQMRDHRVQLVLP